jgi:hypothetical protein
MTATVATTLAPASTDVLDPEPAWTASDFETLSEEAALGLLLRRFRKLIALGCDPAEALVDATRVDIALP